MVKYRAPLILVLLGSYDPTTKRLLYSLKEEVVKAYAGSGVTVYAFILESLTVYELSNNSVLFLENIGERLFTAYFLVNGVLEDIIELKGELNDVLLQVENRYGVRVRRKVRELDKLRLLADYPYSLLIFLREKELTRGGEYIELAYLVSRLRPEEVYKRAWFFKREGIPISTMVKELLTDFKIQYRTYSSDEELIEEVLRVLDSTLKTMK